MRDTLDTMINRATFEYVVAKRQKYVTAMRAADVAEAACVCERRCAPACSWRAALRHLEECAAEVDAAEAAWRAWHAGI